MEKCEHCGKDEVAHADAIIAALKRAAIAEDKIRRALSFLDKQFEFQKQCSGGTFIPDTIDQLLYNILSGLETTNGRNTSHAKSEGKD